MKKILLAGLAATTIALSTGAQAATFTYLDYGFGKIDPDNSNPSNDDYSSLSGAFELGNGPFIAAESTEYGDLDVTAIGAGIYAPVGRASNLFGTLQLVKADYGNNDETGYRFTAGLRSSLADRLEFEGKFKYDDVFRETDSSFALALRYYMTKNFSIGANYDVAQFAQQDQNAIFASLRLAL
ncbi:hypothetical protein C0J08_07550 [Marinomonas sp. CT5]|uniref:hypothetical protein n=1 Tax=Marinomonas sp. CT5 TaxID=2066133 RepID=UPI001835DB4C|nr:hypothetical protein [Marinomonas sp. CT5]NVK72424.1 hypothetical protein [Oceanospirillaceae bacterium]QUX95282.1 hypothetical protein C0J08_07550 [Marinomonas sp. CT5]